MHLSKVARSVLTDTTALVLVLIIGLAGSIWMHVPTAVTLLQVLAIELWAQAYPLSILAKYKGTHRPKHVIKHQAVWETALFGALAAGLAYGNYLLFFARQGISPAYMDTANPLYGQASALAFLTIVLCQWLNLLFIRGDEKKKFFTKFLLSNKKLLRSFGISLFLVLNVLYNPWLHSLFNTQAIDLLDWLTALVAAGLYVGLRVFQRHTREHSRHAVLKLHRELHDKL